MVARSVLPREEVGRIRHEYRQRYGLGAGLIASDGTVIGLGPGAIRNLQVLKRTREHALQESVRWGEPYSFLLAPGIVSWIVPLVNGDTVRGGLCGGEVRPHDDPQDRSETVSYLMASGARRATAEEYVGRLPIWPLARAPETAEWLFTRIYELTLWDPVLLRRNRENALQQRQIAEEIHRRKTSDRRTFSLDHERALLALIRVGDRAGARREMNRLLADIFLYSPRLPVVQGRAIEILGYLVRAAVEDNPELGSLLERHIQWIERMVATRDFETLCAALREALDDFMSHIDLQRSNRHNNHVRQVLRFLAENYMRPIRLEDAARAAGLSRSRVAHLVKECTGKTILQHAKLLRIQKARMWLEETNKDFAEIANDLGFADQSHFIRHFRELTGVPPARYRRNLGRPPKD
jgi:AraC-like DNA-binding protein